MLHLIRATKNYKQKLDRDQLTDTAYRQLFRFEKDHVKWMAEYFLNDSGETRGGALNIIEKMEITLRYLADPGFQTSVAQIMGVSQPTVLTVCIIYVVYYCVARG